MLDHHLQRTIVYRLAFAKSMRFSELKPDDVENKLFDYHLKKTIAEGYVKKNEAGRYALTPDGRKLGLHVLQRGRPLFDQAYSILILAVRRRSDKAWLLYRRKTHPLLGRVGFMHALPQADRLSAEVAAESCLEQTGVTATFRVLGSGFFTTYDQDNLESYVNFTFLVSDDAEGGLRSNDPRTEFFWADDPDFTDHNMLPNMKTLGNLHKANQLFFVEKTFRY
jgi:hypothetical protein